MATPVKIRGLHMGKVKPDGGWQARDSETCLANSNSASKLKGVEAVADSVGRKTPEEGDA